MASEIPFLEKSMWHYRMCVYGSREAIHQLIYMCVCVSAVVGVLATDAVYTLWPQSALKNGVNRAVKLVASCDKVLRGGMPRTFICTYCPKGMFSVCF